jgi:hypothetical protein
MSSCAFTENRAASHIFTYLPSKKPTKQGPRGKGPGAPKEKEKKATYLPTCLFLRFFEILRSDFRKHFYGVFRLLMQRNGQKRDKKNRWEKTKGKKFVFSQLFRPKVFDMDFPQKDFYGVFELPLLRNAQKRHKNISKIKIKKKERYLLTPFSGHLPDIRRFQFSFSSAPLETHRTF